MCLILSVVIQLGIGPAGFAQDSEAASVDSIPQIANQNHFVILLDRSGVFKDTIGQNTFIHLLKVTLPKVLSDSLGYRFKKDYVSMMWFGPTKETPNIDTDFLKEVFLLKDDKRFKDLTLSSTQWWQNRSNWTASSAAFGLALHKLGEAYRNQSVINTVFNKTYLVRISDEVLNTTGSFFAELTNLERSWDELKGFDSAYTWLDEVHNSTTILNPRSTVQFCLSSSGRVSWDAGDYRSASSGFPVKCVITEVVCRPSEDEHFDAAFDSRTPQSLRHHTHRPMSGSAWFKLRSEFLQAHPGLKPLGWRCDVKYDGGAEEVGAINVLSEGLDIDITVAEKNESLPELMTFTAFFSRVDPYLGARLFRLTKTEIYTPDPIHWSESILMAVWPIPEMSQNAVVAWFMALLLLVVFGVVSGPRKAILSIEPEEDANQEPARVVIDLNENSKLPLVLGYVRRSDSNYHRPRIRLTTRIKDFYYIPERQDSKCLQFADNVTAPEGEELPHETIQLALPKELKSYRFRSPETMALRFHPTTIADLTAAGHSIMGGGATISRESEQKIDLSGRFGWTQGRLLGKDRTGMSDGVFNMSVVLRPRLNRTSLEAEELEPIEFEWNQPLTISNLILKGLEQETNFVTDLDLTLRAELRPRSDAVAPDLSFEIKSNGTPNTQNETEPAMTDDSGEEDARPAVTATPLFTTSPLDADSSHPGLRVQGRLPDEGLCLMVKARFGTLQNIKTSIHYDLYVSVVKGRDQVDLLADGKEVATLPEIHAQFIPSHRLATAKLQYVLRAGDTERTYSLTDYRHDGRIEIDRIGIKQVAELPHDADWLVPRYPTLVLGNNASSGNGKVTFALDFENARVTYNSEHITTLGVHEPRRLMSVAIQKVAADTEATSLPEKKLLALWPNLEETIHSYEGKKQVRIDISIIPDGIELNPDVLNTTIELAVPVTVTLDNPDSTDAGMTTTERFPIVWPFHLHREPARGLVAVDFGTSAIAAAYADEGLSEPEGVVLDLQASLKGLDPKRIAFINYEVGKSRFLSGLLGYGDDETVRAQLPDPELPFLQPTGVVFPATRTFLKESEYLVPHLKMLVASGTEDTIIGGKSVKVHDLLKGALESLFSRFVRPQLVNESPQDSDQVLQGIRRVVMTLPNSSLQHHCEMLRKALPMGDGFRFEEDYISFMSESDAAAYSYLYHHATVEDLKRFGSSFKLLVYDCGAGTLDLSLRTVKTDSSQPSSELVRLLSIEGAGNALDDCIMRATQTHIENLRNEEELKDRFDFHVNYLPWDRFESLSGNITQSGWRNYLTELKKDLYYTKNRLSEQVLEGEDFSSLEARVSFAAQMNKMFDIMDGSALSDEELNLLDQEYGITYMPDNRNEGVRDTGKKTRYVRLDIPYEDLEKVLGDQNFYHDHIELPLESIMQEPDGNMVWPDVVLMTGRTALFPGLRQELKEWFEERGKSPELVSFAEDPARMKAIVVQGALAWADRGRKARRFQTSGLYGHYGLLTCENNQWHWYPVCSHLTVEDLVDGTGANVPCGDCEVGSLQQLFFVYSSIDPTPLLKKFNEDQSRPLIAAGPLDVYRHFLKLQSKASAETLRRVANDNGVERVRFEGSYTKQGELLNVEVELRIGDQAIVLTPGDDSKPRSSYSAWPYSLWTEK
ncbi:MAG: hypothetical protein OEV49_00235 [candidate division Zixibacteria bacterium]|nr:hypothetical protein [candidate division Zixibacteria bacterium]MDH3936508.1 hypothetical protein [candidate division Zixibacteria bacterium]